MSVEQVLRPTQTSAAELRAEEGGGRPRASAGSLKAASAGALVIEARRGGPRGQQAWTILVERYSAVVWKVVRAFGLGDAADGWDIFQATWLRALDRLDTIEEPEAFPGWLAKVTLNETYGLLRVRSRLVAVDEVYMTDTAPEAHADRLERDRITEAVTAGLSELPPHQRQLLHLLFDDPPLDYETVGQIIGKTTGYIGPTRKRSLQALARTAPVAKLIEEKRRLAEGDE
jgi:RNA polymerase sigma factor (sigma-70 family)